MPASNTHTTSCVWRLRSGWVSPLFGSYCGGNHNGLEGTKLRDGAASGNGCHMCCCIPLCPSPAEAVVCCLEGCCCDSALSRGADKLLLPVAPTFHGRCLSSSIECCLRQIGYMLHRGSDAKATSQHPGAKHPSASRILPDVLALQSVLRLGARFLCRSSCCRCLSSA